MTGRCTALVDSAGRLTSAASREIVPWWSFTKTMIAAALLRLADQGRIALDRPLPGRPFTPRQLLQHRAGVGDYGSLRDYQTAVARGEEPWAREELLARVPPDRLLFAPGDGWAYSNVGYLLLRSLVEELEGAPLAQAWRALVLEPLELEGPRLAETRADMLQTAFPGGHGYHPGWVFHGTLIGTASDATLALHRLLRWGLLSPASRAGFLDRHPLGGAVPGRPWRAPGYGLGLMMGEMQGGWMPRPLQVLGHSAGGPGSFGAVYHAPASGRTAAVFREAASEAPAEEEVLRLLEAG